MAANPIFFRDFAYVFVAALAGGLIARRLRQPLILGYVLGGILIGPFTPGPKISGLHFLELLAEVGVILLMYSIGIEFSFRDLLRVKWVALLGGPLGIVLSIALAVGVGKLVGWPISQAITVGALISVASTMVLSRLLIDRGELHSRHGSVTIGITLVEDVAVVVMTVLLPSLAALGSSDRYMAVLAALGRSALLLIPVSVAAFLLVPRIMTRIARTGSQELYLLVALAIGFAPPPRPRPLVSRWLWELSLRAWSSASPSTLTRRSHKCFRCGMRLSHCSSLQSAPLSTPLLCLRTCRC